MRKFGKLLLIIGIILVVAGFGIQLYASANSDFQSLSSTLKQYTGQALTPQYVGELLKETKTSFYGYSLRDLIKTYGGSDANQMLTYLQVYAATPTMIYCGIAAAVLGFIMNAAARKREN